MYNYIHCSYDDETKCLRQVLEIVMQSVSCVVIDDRWEHTEEECLPLCLLASMRNNSQPVVTCCQISQC